MRNQRSKVTLQRAKVKTKHFIYFICVFEILLFIFGLPTASAEGVSLRVAPSLLQIRVNPPSVINAPLTIENLSDKSVILKASFRPFKASSKANGEIEYIGESGLNADIFQNITLTERSRAVSEFSLGPKQKKEFQLSINLPATVTTKDHYFSVIFTNSNVAKENSTDPNTQHSYININTAIAMNVLLSVGAQNEPAAFIEEFTSQEFVENGPMPFTVKLKNNTSKYIRPKGDITIRNMFGQTIGRVEIPTTTILANSSRYLESNPSQPTPHKLQPVVFWDEGFLLGFYEAKLAIELTPGGPTIERNIKFTAFPFKLIVSVLTFVVIFWMIRKRVKTRMSER